MNVSTTYSSSMRPICVEPYRRMSRISIVGVHIDHLVNARPANQRRFSFDLERPTAKSPRSLFWADCITFIGVPRDGRYFCALQPCIKHIGVRFLLRPNNPVSDALCLFCNPAREPGNPARCDNALFDGRVGSPANSGVLRLGSITAAVPDSRS
jgi:hypothetical protein